MNGKTAPYFGPFSFCASNTTSVLVSLDFRSAFTSLFAGLIHDLCGPKVIADPAGKPRHWYV
ncbi:MAG: hypothetical protein WBM54_07755, partial [Woeseia sp.]